MISPYELESGLSPVYPEGSIKGDNEVVLALRGLINQKIAPLVGNMTLQRDYDIEDFPIDDDLMEGDEANTIIFDAYSAHYNPQLHVTTEIYVSASKQLEGAPGGDWEGYELEDDGDTDYVAGLDVLSLPNGEGDLIDTMTIEMQMFPGKFHLMQQDGKAEPAMTSMNSTRRLGAMWLKLAPGGEILHVDAELGDYRFAAGNTSLESDIPLEVHIFSDIPEGDDSQVNIPNIRKFGEWLTSTEVLPVAQSCDDLAKLDVQSTGL